MTRADRILAVVIALVALVSIPVIAGASGHGDGRAVVNGPAGQTVVDLGVDRTVVIAGLHGDVTAEVSGGAIRVTGSGCPDQICVHSAALDERGGVIACVPNGVTITVGFAGERGLDAIVR
jgi:hypothetical protein